MYINAMSDSAQKSILNISYYRKKFLSFVR
jgi:hypothetical protein